MKENQIGAQDAGVRRRVQEIEDLRPGPRGWASATFEALEAKGAGAQIEWYEGEQHAFGPRFND